MGLQFENLVLNNLKTIAQQFDISSSNIVAAGPYFQHKTTRQNGCQVDLLIQTQSPELSIRPVLIYNGELAPSIINFEKRFNIATQNMFLFPVIPLTGNSA